MLRIELLADGHDGAVEGLTPPKEQRRMAVCSWEEEMSDDQKVKVIVRRLCLRRKFRFEVGTWPVAFLHARCASATCEDVKRQCHKGNKWNWMPHALTAFCLVGMVK